MEKRMARFIQGDRPEAGAELAMTEWKLARFFLGVALVRAMRPCFLGTVRLDEHSSFRSTEDPHVPIPRHSGPEAGPEIQYIAIRRGFRRGRDTRPE
jgi:hypothetical protein